MIKTIEKRICDVCKKEVEFFYGSLVLDYLDAGCNYHVKIERKEVCIDCCRKLDKVIEKALEELEE